MPVAGGAAVQSIGRPNSLDAFTAVRPTRLIAVSDDENLVIAIYDPSGQYVRGLSNLASPQGLANDNLGNLYAVDETNSRIDVFSGTFTGAPKTISDPGQYPVGVAVSPDGEYIAVVNLVTTSYGPGSVVVYANGIPGPTITNPAIEQGSFAAFDAKGNLYVTFAPNGSGCPCIGEIDGATRGGTAFRPLRTSNGISPYGIEVTTSGQIALLDQGNNTVYTYNPPSGGSLGAPVLRTVLHGYPKDNPLNSPAQFAFSDDMNDLYVASNSDNNSLFEFAYPSGDYVSQIAVGGLPFGVAIFPRQYPQ